MYLSLYPLFFCSMSIQYLSLGYCWRFLLYVTFQQYIRMLSKKPQKGHKILTFTHTGLCAPNTEMQTQRSVPRCHCLNQLEGVGSAKNKTVNDKKKRFKYNTHRALICTFHLLTYWSIYKLFIMDLFFSWQNEQQWGKSINYKWLNYLSVLIQYLVKDILVSHFFLTEFQYFQFY